MREAEELFYIVPALLRDAIQIKFRNVFKSDESFHSILETIYTGVVILQIKTINIFDIPITRQMHCTLIDKEFANYIFD